MARKHDILYVNFYTDGSAARKISPAFPQTQPKQQPRAHRQKKTVVYVDPVAICSLMVAAVLLVMMAAGVSQFQNARQEAEAMESYLQTLEEANQELSALYAQGVDLEEVEKTALALGMIPKAEAQSVQIRLSEPQPQPQPTVWDQFLAFLTNLFA